MASFSWLKFADTGVDSAEVLKNIEKVGDNTGDVVASLEKAGSVTSEGTKIAERITKFVDSYGPAETVGSLFDDVSEIGGKISAGETRILESGAITFGEAAPEISGVESVLAKFTEGTISKGDEAAAKLTGIGKEFTIGKEAAAETFVDSFKISSGTTLEKSLIDAGEITGKTSSSLLSAIKENVLGAGKMTLQVSGDISSTALKLVKEHPVATASIITGGALVLGLGAITKESGTIVPAGCEGISDSVQLAQCTQCNTDQGIVGAGKQAECMACVKKGGSACFVITAPDANKKEKEAVVTADICDNTKMSGKTLSDNELRICKSCLSTLNLAGKAVITTDQAKSLDSCFECMQATDDTPNDVNICTGKSGSPAGATNTTQQKTADTTQKKAADTTTTQKSTTGKDVCDLSGLTGESLAACKSCLTTLNLSGITTMSAAQQATIQSCLDAAATKASTAKTATAAEKAAMAATKSSGASPCDATGLTDAVRAACKECYIAGMTDAALVTCVNGKLATGTTETNPVAVLKQYAVPIAIGAVLVVGAVVATHGTVWGKKKGPGGKSAAPAKK